ncbi:extracellular solute-binding protein [Phaeovulum sp.]|uniref:extracellular solute-binding protein n=1 Tax=Phaeovulum sp. TaxID=2934796 RepID=UPI0027304112|nr:extracellular solute-binding protein [Phaeovulum sp.]MDP1667996.1 extracellular solute-binding protein [Phaeovulum sp.]MDP2061687.1 extracellular solute-binding protein [Phaeovulum sp.]MDZ4119445.1 extracellular solute-binding protein [Phaeovulum sp.]
MAKVAVRRSARPIDLAAATLLAAALWLVLALGAMAQVSTIRSHGISTFGDLKYGPDYAHLDYVNPNAPKGGEISIWASGGFDSYNPYSIKGRAAALSSAPLESLLTGTSDEIGSAYGLLAESMEYPESRDWVIFTLRAEARFSDGSPLTAEDVLFSYELLRDKGLSSFRGVISQMIAGAEVLDPLHIKFTFMPDFPRRDVIQAAGGLPVFSKAEFTSSGRDLQETSNIPYIGSGPYVFDSADEGRRVVWRRNPDYWGQNLPINIGRNNFDRIRIEYFADYEAAFEGFKAGAYTFRNEASSLIWATRYNFPALNNGWVVKRELPNGNIGSGQSFVLNLRREKFQDPRVREALGLMFNFEWSNETLFYGIYARTTSFWDNSELAASGTPSPEELALLTPLADQLPPGVLTDPAVLPPTSGANQLDRANMRLAAALLDEAGWAVGADGMRRNARGETLVVEFLNESQSFDRVINPYVENLRAIGVDAVHNRVDDAQMTSRERSHDFDIVTDQLGQDYIPGSGLQQYFGSASTEDAFNTMGLQSPAVDALISNIEAADTRAEMTVAVQALDRVLRAYRFWVPQWFKDSHTVAYFDMYEHPETLPPYSLGELDFWWVNAEKAATLKAAGAF